MPASMPPPLTPLARARSVTGFSPVVHLIRARLTALARTLLEGLIRLQARERERRALLDLDDRLLRDIGLTRLEARREAARLPFRNPDA